SRHEQLFLFLQPVLDTRAVPDFDRDCHAEHRGEHDERIEPGIWRREVEDTALAEISAKSLTGDLQPDRGGKQNHNPVNLKPSHQAPDMLMEIGEKERREVPDSFLWANLAEPAASESAADRKGQRDEFASDEWWNADR